MRMIWRTKIQEMKWKSKKWTCRFNGHTRYLRKQEVEINILNKLKFMMDQKMTKIKCKGMVKGKMNNLMMVVIIMPSTKIMMELMLPGYRDKINNYINSKCSFSRCRETQENNR